MMQRQLKRRGFTLIEVLIVIAVTTLGFVSLLNLQIGTLRTALSSRDMQQGMNLAEHVSQTMRMETLRWTPTTSISGLIGVKYLNNAPTSLAAGATSGWLTAYPPVSGQKDARVGAVGNDTTYDSGILGELTPGINANYCVHYRLTWLVPDLLMRADIRVMWPRNQSQFTKYATCPQGMESNLHDINTITTPMTLIRNIFVRQVT